MAPLATIATQCLGIQYPILQAPIGSGSCPELVAAVSNAGGLGMLAASWREEATLRQMLQEIHALTRQPFGVNLVLPWPQGERVRICLEEGVRIFSFSWGDPAPYLPMLKAEDALAIQMVGSAEDARRAVDQGVDLIIAQGWEAGGHVLGQVASFPLIPAVVDAVAPVPVVASGGIVDGRGIAAALILGAAGVSLGSRFLASQEASVHPTYKDRLLQATETDTVYSTLFDIGWPEAPHRTLRNSTWDQWQAAGSPESGHRPGEKETVALTAQGEAIVIYSDMPPLPGMTGDLEAMALYAGQGVGGIHQVQSAAQILAELVEETLAALRQGTTLL